VLTLILFRHVIFVKIAIAGPDARCLASEPIGTLSFHRRS